MEKGRSLGLDPTGTTVVVGVVKFVAPSVGFDQFLVTRQEVDKTCVKEMSVECSSDDCGSPKTRITAFSEQSVCKCMFRNLVNQFE